MKKGTKGGGADVTAGKNQATTKGEIVVESESEESSEYESEEASSDAEDKFGTTKGKNKRGTKKPDRNNRSNSFSRASDEDKSDNNLEKLAGLKTNQFKTTPGHIQVLKDLNKIRDEAVARKIMIRDVTAKYGINANAVKKMHEVYLEQETPERLSYNKFLKFIKLDDTPLLRNVFELVAGGANEKIDIRLALLYFMNCSTQSKDEKLKFAFNLFDEEDSRMITYKELMKIIQANYFAGSTDEIAKKAKLILDEAKSKSGDDAIAFEDYMSLSKKFSALFFPTGL